MGLEKRSESKTVFLAVKGYCLWQEIKRPVEGCEEMEVKNPRTGQVMTKYGYAFNSVSGYAAALEKYDRTHEGTRYFGFKLKLKDGEDSFVVDMPYQSAFLRRFLKVAPSINWSQPLKISVFKGKGGKHGEELGVWFQQNGETVKPYFTRDNPNGMPPAAQDPDTHEWDFRAQHRWLIEHLKSYTIPTIEDAARRTAPPVRSHPDIAADESDAVEAPPFPDGITDDDVPFRWRPQGRGRQAREISKAA